MNIFGAITIMRDSQFLKLFDKFG